LTTATETHSPHAGRSDLAVSRPATRYEYAAEGVVS
jgi:hypothetical protein